MEGGEPTSPSTPPGAATTPASSVTSPGTSACSSCACGPSATPSISCPLPGDWTSASPPPPMYRPIRSPTITPPSPTASQAAIMLSPVPHPQSVPVAGPPYSFVVPTKRILTPEDVHHFLASPSGSNFLGFVAALSHSVLRRKISDPLPRPLSKTLESLQNLLQALSLWVDETPPAPHQARYGNPAYRTWHQRLDDEAGTHIANLLPEDLKPSVVELTPYFLDSFGNASRIDYGTGHETNFAAFLYCLARLGLLQEEDYQGLVLRVFITYLDLMRKLQETYSLEPAGSHGVWGLDDYHFLPLVFGAAQLVDHKYMKPKSIHNQDILDNFSKEYMYLGCIAFVKKVKKGPFAEHSPLLNDISGVAAWNKVHSGMLKMYRAEVLEKFPIMQHFLFGSLLKWE